MIRLLLIIFLFLGLLNKSYSQVSSNLVDYLHNINILVENSSGFGSGFLIAKKDATYVLSAGHLVEKIEIDTNFIPVKKIEKEVIISLFSYKNDFLISSQSSKAKLIAHSDSDTKLDISLFKLEKQISTNSVKFFTGKTSELRVGTKIVHIGNPRGWYRGSISTGIITNKRIANNVLYQSNFDVTGGCSGGLVSLESGEMIGVIVTMDTKNSEINFFTPLDPIKDWAIKNKLEWIFEPYDKKYNKPKEFIED